VVGEVAERLAAEVVHEDKIGLAVVYREGTRGVAVLSRPVPRQQRDIVPSQGGTVRLLCDDLQLGLGALVDGDQLGVLTKSDDRRRVAD
jgi:hypothetical protein